MNMVKKVKNFMTSLPMTIAGGVFLVLSFVLSKLSVNLFFSPAWITVIICGIPLVYNAIYKLINANGLSRISSALLISIAMIAAIGIGDLFAAGEVAFIMAVGEILEDVTTGRARRGLKKLVSLAPTEARLVKDGKEEMIPAEKIKEGDILRILPGEAIPADGVVCEGETSVDQSVMTGESLPVDKSVGDEVYCGTINRFGTALIRVTRTGEDSSLKKLVRMVREAEDKKAPMARTADKAASILVPVALLVAVVTGIVTRDIVRAVTVLVVFCPCALVLATPTAIMAAIGQATGRGVVIKSGEALEKMSKVDTVCFDKTGTITRGAPGVSDIIPLSQYTEDEILSLCASVEQRSEHPLGKAVVAFAKERELKLIECNSFTMKSGMGASAEVWGREVYCGNEKYLANNKMNMDDKLREALDSLRGEGKASVIVACDNKCIGVIGLSDELRCESASVSAELSRMGVDSVLLTGDNELTAGYFARKAGIGKVHAGLLPEEKVSVVDTLRNQHKTVCMVGDGVNDAPALKTADVSVAMGDMGSDIAVEAADIALMSDDLSAVPYVKRLSLATVRTIRLGIILSCIINIFSVVMSVMGVLNPTTGALVHNAGSVIVVLISALLYDRKFR